jgi:hypothetical protein
MAKEDVKAEAVAPTGTARVIWHPEDGDPGKMTMNGIEFKANVPVILPLSKTISYPERKEYFLPDGTLQSRGVETKKSMVEILRTNPSFSVDGVRPPRKSASARLPDDADKYRGYALRWIRESTSHEQIVQRWDGEQELRDRCGCAQKDIAYLTPFLEARKDQVKDAA